MSISTTSSSSRARAWRALALAALGAAALLAGIALAYELALAKVPQHRAALEKVVRAQTGLDIRFGELALRWGWYGPEAVFSRVELGEPGTTAVLLRAPQLVVGFDVWRTLRSGQPEAGRIWLVEPDIHLDSVIRSRGAAAPGSRTGVAAPGSRAGARSSPGADTGTSTAVRILQRWRGGHIDIEGGVVHLPDPAGSTTPLSLAIRHAAVRRSDDEWSVFGLVFLPERVGRTARIALRVNGELAKPRTLSGSAQIEGHALSFAGLRDLIAPGEPFGGYLPRTGGGDVGFNIDFAHGEIARARGDLRATGVGFEAPEVRLDRLRGAWHLTRGGDRWRLQADSVSIGQMDHVRLAASFRVVGASSGWQVALDRLDLSCEEVRLSLSGTLESRAAGGGSRVVGRGALMGADVTFLQRLLGEGTTRVFGAVASRLTAGKIEDAEFELGDGAAFRGSLRLREATVSGGDLWPQIRNLNAQLTWRDEGIAAVIEAARAGDFTLQSARVSWDAAGARPTHLTGRVAGRLEAALEWLRQHPSLQRYAPGVIAVPGSGPAVLDLDVSLPVEASAVAQTKVVATLDGARLPLAAGLAPVRGLTGALTFSDGRLERSTLEGQWLGGPINVRLDERPDRGRRVWVAEARGSLQSEYLARLIASQAMSVAMESSGEAVGTLREPALPVSGVADWSARVLYQVPSERDSGSQWRVQAESSLTGVSSALAEPFRKLPDASLPVRIDASGSQAAGQLRVRIGDRLRGAFALRGDDNGDWSVERGVVALGTANAILPGAPGLLIRGRLERLDLPAYLVALRLLGANTAVPPVAAQIQAAQLTIAGHAYENVTLRTQGTERGTDVALESASLSGTARFPKSGPGDLHLGRLVISDGLSAGEAETLVAALSPATQVGIDQLVWRGRALGRLTTTLETRADLVAMSDMRLAAVPYITEGEMRCQLSAPTCRLSFELKSSDVAGTLAAFGFRPDVEAAGGTFTGTLQWNPDAQPWMRGVEGSVSLRVEDGTTLAAATTAGPPFALFMVPALLDGMDSAQGEQGGNPLRFTRLDADFALRNGQATTANLHFDGDAEILMRGRTGLLARDYDQQVWILRGEERLPAAVRRFGATPRIAAVWLSMRQLFSAEGAQERSQAVLRLQGGWDDPMVGVQPDSVVQEHGPVER